MSSAIDSISQATASAGASTAKSAKEAVMGKEDFLSLLVAQLQHQDPLNPDEPTEFTAQLAQFSSLEQLFSLNDSMENLVTANASSERLTTLTTLGKEVTYHAADFNFTGEPMEIGYQLDGEATSVTLELQRNGIKVATLEGVELEAGSHLLSWDGRTSGGEAAPTGTYTIVVKATGATDEGVAVAPLIRSQVTGVDLDGGYGGVLITRAGQVSFSSILGVFEPAVSNLTASTTGE